MFFVVQFRSKLKPKTFGCFTVGMRVLLICRFRVLSYSEGSKVNKLEVDLSGFSFRLFSYVHLCKSERNGFRFLCALSRS